jgi:hypothetical protein
MMEDQEIRSKIVEKQKNRLDDFKKEKIILRLESILSKVK